MCSVASPAPPHRLRAGSLNGAMLRARPRRASVANCAVWYPVWGRWECIVHKLTVEYPQTFFQDNFGMGYFWIPANFVIYSVPMSVAAPAAATDLAAAVLAAPAVVAPVSRALTRTRKARVRMAPLRTRKA